MPKIVTLSEAASIGIHSMVLIAKSKDYVNVQKIAKVTSDSKHHIAKVMHILVREGFITSVRGPKGGFKLNKPPEEISLLDIYEAIEGKLESTECPANKEHCPFKSCILENITNKMTLDFKNSLQNKTLDQFI
jgi:Rrf2 family protein